MYQMDARVRYSEVDETHRIKLESVLDYFQDCCTFHSEDVGGGLEFLKGQKRVAVSFLADRHKGISEVGRADTDHCKSICIQEFFRTQKSDAAG